MTLQNTFSCLLLTWIGTILLLSCASTDGGGDDYTAPVLLAKPVSTQVIHEPVAGWSVTEVDQLRSLWLGNLSAPPIDPSNVVSDNRQAALLGHHLFFDTRLSANGQVACASCHIPTLSFTDGLARSFGTRRTERNAMTLVGVAYSPWFLWDGHKDSLWSQALEPLEHPDEHGTTRLHVVHLIYQDEVYHHLYEAIFGSLPEALADFSRFPDSGGPVKFGSYRASWNVMAEEDQATATEVFVNIGKAIAAYERLLLPGPSRFDDYVQAVLSGEEAQASQTLNANEVAGLRLFLGQGDCIRCHNGPLFTDFAFHNTGVPLGTNQVEDQGHLAGQALVVADEFNCFGQHSDTNPTSCHLTQVGAVSPPLLYRFKTPTLRNIADTAPYMHRGQFETLAAILVHYNEAEPAPLGQSELKSLGLSEQQLRQLIDFLGTLSAPLATPPALLKAPDLTID